MYMCMHIETFVDASWTRFLVSVLLARTFTETNRSAKVLHAWIDMQMKPHNRPVQNATTTLRKEIWRNGIEPCSIDANFSTVTTGDRETR